MTLEERIKQLEERNAELEKRLADKDSRIADLDSAIASKDSHIADLDRKIVSKDNRIAYLEQQLYGSRSEKRLILTVSILMNITKWSRSLLKVLFWSLRRCTSVESYATSMS